MSEYVIYPALVTCTDEGHEVKREPARLIRNDGSESTWVFDSTAEAKDRADLWFDIQGWKTDDLGILFSTRKGEDQ